MANSTSGAFWSTLGTNLLVVSTQPFCSSLYVVVSTQVRPQSTLFVAFLSAVTYQRIGSSMSLVQIQADSYT